LKNDAGEIDAGIFAKRGGEAPNFAFPGGAVKNGGFQGLAGMNLRSFLG
jgi:hypothetical protein